MREQILEPGDLFRNLFMLLLDLPAFEGCEPAQLHIQNCLRLEFAQFKTLDQVRLGNIGILRFTDRFDHRVEIVKRDQIAIENMLRARPSPNQNSCADNDRLAMFNENLQRTFQRERARLAIHQSQ